jgi:FkbM family methyltransferase
MRSALKTIVNSFPQLYRLATFVRSCVRPSTGDILQKMVRSASKQVEHPIFVKVGANDGVTGDLFGRSFLTCHQWKGLLIEPVPYCAERLSGIYSDRSRFVIDSRAVGAVAGTTNFFYVAERARSAIPNLPKWYDQLGSFDRQHIVKHLGGALECYIESMIVNVAPLGDILSDHKILGITLLHIDTEGADLEVLRSLDFSSVRPAWIMVEHKHLTAADRSEMVRLLRLQGYDVVKMGGDFFAIHSDTCRELGLSERMSSMLARFPPAC